MKRMGSYLAVAVLLLALVASARRLTPTQFGERQPSGAIGEIVFKAENLGCTLVDGVGCGHLLAPTLAQINDLDGVAGSSANWTGTLIRVSATPTADSESIANQVEAALRADQQVPVRIVGDELLRALDEEEWRGLDRICDLTSYEFNTFAKRQINSFADGEQLDQSQRERLLALVDRLWEKAAEGMGQPEPQAAAYLGYWQNRLNKFTAVYAQHARDVLSADQVEKLIRMASRAEQSN